MRKEENHIRANIGEFSGRITRARAAAFTASAQLPPKVPAHQQERQVVRANLKRAASEENSCHSIAKSSRPCKRRAVLQDVSNIGCEPLYSKCFNATKIEPNSHKPTIRNRLKKSKGASSVGVANSKVPLGLRTKGASSVGAAYSKPLDLRTQGVQANAKSKAKLKVERSSNSEDPETYHRVGGIKEEVTSDFRDDNWRSQSHSESQNFQNKEKVLLLGTRSNLDITDIDCNDRDAQLCTVYAQDIYNNLRVAELTRRPRPNFMETVQTDITQSMRGILVDWLVEVSEEYKLVPDTLYLTVFFIDWFLSQNYIERQKLQLLGISCMLIASKYEEICAPRVEDFCFITDSTYTKEEVLNMEGQILKHMGFQLSAPTAKSFLRRYVRAAQTTYKTPSLELECLANYLAELTLVDYGFLNFLPSVIAASAVFLSKWTLDQSSHPWNSTLEYYTSYKASDLKQTVVALQDLQLNTNGCPLSSIRVKYRQEKFKAVATLSSPKLLDTLF
ncbi:cyclin-A2-4-like [Benincasa hispida]|uniref:cyclin-A2-4-like n=1 Tax=Benincasa hispida TaxID=102211 RepID=UPI001901629B|nr:cyclin-A2-4-like [Benincasa hispida]XP_038900185.1 cyclin-A2-4-like [Benincasa hispida]